MLDYILSMFYGVGQGAVLTKIRAYLLCNGMGEDFVKQFEEGYCSGISTVWLYAKWLQTQPKTSEEPRDDYEWFKTTIEFIVNWQEPEKEIKKLLDEIIAEKNELYAKYEKEKTPRDQRLPYEKFIEQKLTELAKSDKAKAGKLKELIDNNRRMDGFINSIQFFQNIQRYLPIGQANLKRSLEDTKITEGRKLDREYSIGSLFTLEQLKQLLKMDQIIQDGKLILVTSHDHSTALFKKGNTYYYFDPNSSTGEVQVYSTDKVAEMIFRANNFGFARPSPLGFRMFSFDGIVAAYPSVSDVLDKIGPSLIPEANYANRDSGLHSAARIGSLECVQYFLAKGVDPNIQNEDGKTAIIYAAVNGYSKCVQALLKNSKVDPNIEGKDGKTALALAVRDKRIDIVEMLLTNGATIATLSSDKQISLLKLATKNGATGFSKLLLQQVKANNSNNSKILAVLGPMSGAILIVVIAGLLTIPSLSTFFVFGGFLCFFPSILVLQEAIKIWYAIRDAELQLSKEQKVASALLPNDNQGNWNDDSTKNIVTTLQENSPDVPEVKPLSTDIPTFSPNYHQEIQTESSHDESPQLHK